MEDQQKILLLSALTTESRTLFFTRLLDSASWLPGRIDVYHAHDLQLANILEFLDVPFGFIPFSSVIIFERHQSGKIIVKYNGKTVKQFESYEQIFDSRKYDL
jgi:hypothetical protein